MSIVTVTCSRSQAAVLRTRGIFFSLLFVLVCFLYYLARRPASELSSAGLKASTHILLFFVEFFMFVSCCPFRTTGSRSCCGVLQQG